LDTTVEKKLKGLEGIGHEEAGNVLHNNIDQGTKRRDEVLCVKESTGMVTSVVLQGGRSLLDITLCTG
jgi:hypothetical protein